MDAFPNISAPSGMERALSDKYVEATFETGDDAARPLFSTPREQPMTLSWAYMTTADLATLRAFYAAHRATRFLWSEPRTGVQYVTRFVSDCLKWRAMPDVVDGWSVTLTMLPVREA